MPEPTTSDPGNLPARMAEVIGSHEWDGFPRSAHNQHNYYGACAVCQRDITRIAEVALGVRDELVAHLSARAAKAEARVEHAEAGAQLSSERLAEVRQELAEAKAAIEREQYEKEQMRAERDGAVGMAYAAETKLNALRVALDAHIPGGAERVLAATSRRLANQMCAAQDTPRPVEGTTTPARETA